MDQVRWWFATYGLTFLLCDAKLIDRARRFMTLRSPFVKELLACYMCTGTWVSGGLVLLRAGHTGHFVWMDVVVDTFAGAVFCYVINTVLLALEGIHDRYHQAD